jgi:fermentation-respiration switch protein FrsA (DUF1100 family)
MIRSLGVILALLFVVILGGMLLLGPLERFLIYFPVRADPAQPLPRLAHGELSETPLETTDGERVYVWHLVSRHPRLATVLFFHGNGGNVFHRSEHIDGMAAVGLDVVLLEYRGYGKSTGTPSEPGLYRDAAAAYRYLTSKAGVPAEEIVLFGESLGSAVATDLALREPAAGLVLESAFPSVRALGRLHYPFLPGNLYDFLSHRYDTGEKIGRVSLPVLVIHGTEDDIVPVRMGRALYDAAPEPRFWYEVEGADHNDLPFAGGQRYFERLADFARETTGQ